MHLDINISQASKTEEIIINRMNKKMLILVSLVIYLCWFAAKIFSVPCGQLIVLNSSSIPPLLFDLAWASGENFENKPIHVLIFCSLMLAMTQASKQRKKSHESE